MFAYLVCSITSTENDTPLVVCCAMDRICRGVVVCGPSMWLCALHVLICRKKENENEGL